MGIQSISSLPAELLLSIFEYLPAKSLYNCHLVCYRWGRISILAKITFKVLLSIDTFQVPIRMNINRDKTIGLKTADFSNLCSEEFYIVAQISTLSLLMKDSNECVVMEVQMLLQNFVKANSKYLISRDIRIVFEHLLDRQRSESSYNYNLPMERSVFLKFARLSKVFRIVTIRHPLPQAPYHLLSQNCCASLNFERVHNLIEGFDRLTTIKSLRMESDGRFLTQDGQFDFSGFKSLSNSKHLRHLILEGPWLECMINFSIGAVEAIKAIVGLETLIIDLDMIKFGPELLYSVITSLPNLKRMGRLGRVDKRFWRQFPKHSCKNLTTIELGSLKVPHTLLKDVPKSFLKDMAHGTSWAFPNMKCLKIFLGFQSVDVELLLELIKALKEGIPLVFKEYEASILPDPFSRMLEQVQIFQMSDVDLIQEPRWKYVASRHGGGRPISIFATDHSTIEMGSGHAWKEF